MMARIRPPVPPLLGLASQTPSSHLLSLTAEWMQVVELLVKLKARVQQEKPDDANAKTSRLDIGASNDTKARTVPRRQAASKEAGQKKLRAAS